MTMQTFTTHRVTCDGCGDWHDFKDTTPGAAIYEVRRRGWVITTDGPTDAVKDFCKQCWHFMQAANKEPPQ